jgi:hypothetical protein
MIRFFEIVYFWLKISFFINFTFGNSLALGLRRAAWAKLEASFITVNQSKLVGNMKPGTFEFVNFYWCRSHATPNFNLTNIWQVAEFTPKTLSI